MTRTEIMMQATAGRLTWLQAADVLGISPRHMRRLRAEYQEHGISAFEDKRAGSPRRRRIREETVTLICRLKEDVYEDFSVMHFYDKLVEDHGIKISYSWTKQILQDAGIVKEGYWDEGYWGRQNEEAASRSGKMIWTKNLNQEEPLHEKEILYWP